MLGKRGSVMLFVRGLPEDVSGKELKHFIQTAVRELDSRPFSLKATVCNCNIVCVSDREDDSRNYHGLVEVQPAKAAIDAIGALNGRELRGHKIEVRRYQHRSPLRDQRDEPAGYTGESADLYERRRRNLRIDLVNA
jgi:hypothetical protein